jgi:HPt (histidine-containing phosphotransfer) domain-containing protein
MLDRLRSLGGADLVARVVDAFLSEGRTRITRGLEGASAGDLTRVADAAHSLISSTAQLGATRMADLSREIEALARAGDAAGVRARLEEWSARFDAAEAALRDARGNG